MIRRAGLALALAAVLGGCELTTVEVAQPDDVVVVEAYLRTDVASQEVFLYRTLPGPDNTLRVEGAEVRVVGREGAVLAFSAHDEGPGCARYSVLPEGEAGTCYLSEARSAFVQPGERYRLEVTLPDGRELGGETTVPGAFDVLHPLARTCVLEAPGLEMLWTQSAGAWSYVSVAELSNLAQGLAAAGVEDPPDELELTGLSIGGADTTIVFPGQFGVFDRFSLDRDLLLALQDGLPAGGRADIALAAADRNYVNWVRGGNFNPSGQVRVPSVSGDGTGVFGSLVVTRRVLLTPESENSEMWPICE